MCGHVGSGRQPELKIRWPLAVWVRVPLSAPLNSKESEMKIYIVTETVKVKDSRERIYSALNSYKNREDAMNEIKIHKHNQRLHLIKEGFVGENVTEEMLQNEQINPVEYYINEVELKDEFTGIELKQDNKHLFATTLEEIAS